MQEWEAHNSSHKIVKLMEENSNLLCYFFHTIKNFNLPFYLEHFVHLPPNLKTRFNNRQIAPPPQNFTIMTAQHVSFSENFQVRDDVKFALAKNYYYWPGSQNYSYWRHRDVLELASYPREDALLPFYLNIYGHFNKKKPASAGAQGSFVYNQW